MPIEVDAVSRPADTKRDSLHELLLQPLPADAAELVSSATERLIEESGTGLALAETNLSGADLRGFNLRRANLNRARLDGAQLDGADLSESTLINPIMERSCLRGARVEKLYAHALAVVSSDWSQTRMRGALDCTGALFHGVDFSDADLSGGNYAGTTFYQCDLSRANLRNCELSGVTFNECVMRETRLDGARVSHMTITRTQAAGISLVGAVGTGVALQSMGSLPGADFSQTHLYHARIRSTELRDVNFSNAALLGLDMSDVALTNIELMGADLSEASLRAVSGNRNSFRRAQLSDTSFINCRMAETDFSGAGAECARFLRCTMPGSLFTSFDDERGRASFTARGLTARDCDFSGADFSHAYLYGASFIGDPVGGMQLDGARFTGANLVQTTISASLRGVDLRRALCAYSRLTRSDLTNADLTGAALHQATLIKVILTNAILTGVKAPIFTDRCRGIDSASLDEELRQWCDSLASLLDTSKRAST